MRVERMLLEFCLITLLTIAFPYCVVASEVPSEASHEATIKAELFLRIADVGLESFPDESTMVIIADLKIIARKGEAAWPAWYLMMLGERKNDLGLVMQGAQLYYAYWAANPKEYRRIGSIKVCNQVLTCCYKALQSKANQHGSHRAPIPRAILDKLLEQALQPGLSRGYWRLLEVRLSPVYNTGTLPGDSCELHVETRRLMERRLASAFSACGLAGKVAITEINWREDSWLEALVHKYEKGELDKKGIDLLVIGLRLYARTKTRTDANDPLVPLYIYQAIVRLYEQIGEEPPNSFAYFEVIRHMERVNRLVAEGKTLTAAQDLRPFIAILKERYKYSGDSNGGTIEQWLANRQEPALALYRKLTK